MKLTMTTTTLLLLANIYFTFLSIGDSGCSISSNCHQQLSEPSSTTTTKLSTKMDSGFWVIGRAVTSCLTPETTVRFQSSATLYTIMCIEKTKVNKTKPGLSQVFKNGQWLWHSCWSCHFQH